MITWTLDDLVERFDVLSLGTSPSIFDPEKLRWMNGRYIRELSDDELGERLVAYLTRVGFFDDCGRVMAAGGRGAAGAGAPSSRRPTRRTAGAVPPTQEQEALARTVAPLVREKIDVLAEFIPIAGWFFKPLTFADDARERLRHHARGGRARCARRPCAWPRWRPGTWRTWRPSCAACPRTWA